MSTPRVIAVCASPSHSMSKPRMEMIRLIKGLGVDGDAHCGEKVKHRSRVRQDPTQANLRQVHLMHAELFEELLARGYTLHPGVMGENITTQGLDILNLPGGTHLHLGPNAVLEVTGLRNPCLQLNSIAPGLMEEVLQRTGEHGLIRKAGIMSIVVASGVVRAGDTIGVEFPIGPHKPLKPV